jgi:hypothetical protein
MARTGIAAVLLETWSCELSYDFRVFKCVIHFVESSFTSDVQIAIVTYLVRRVSSKTERQRTNFIRKWFPPWTRSTGCVSQRLLSWTWSAFLVELGTCNKVSDSEIGDPFRCTVHVCCTGGYYTQAVLISVYVSPKTKIPLPLL